MRWFGGIDPVLFERYVAEVFAFGPEVLVTGTAQMAAVRQRNAPEGACLIARHEIAHFGMSGNTSERVAAVTASARSLPLKVR